MGIDVDGGLRTEVTVDAAQLIPVPGNPDPVALALVEPLAVGVHACARAGIRAGIVVGIMGGGAIGMAAALQAREIGATVQIIEPDIARREAARALGYHATPPGQPVGREWDAAIDTVGIESTIAAAFGNVRQASTICVVGLASGHHLPASEDLVRREITLLGSFCYTSDDLLTAAALVGAYGLECIPFESISGLENAPDALDAFAGGRLGRGKTIIVP